MINPLAEHANLAGPSALHAATVALKFLCTAADIIYVSIGGIDNQSLDLDSTWRAPGE